MPTLESMQKDIVLRAARQAAFDFIRSLPFELDVLVSNGVVTEDEINAQFRVEVHLSVTGDNP